jgi:hypothetical protein
MLLSLASFLGGRLVLCGFVCLVRLCLLLSGFCGISRAFCRFGRLRGFGRFGERFFGRKGNFADLIDAGVANETVLIRLTTETTRIKGSGFAGKRQEQEEDSEDAQRPEVLPHSQSSSSFL